MRRCPASVRRAYITADAPADFDRALADFVVGRPVSGKRGFTFPRESPRAPVAEAIGSAELTIAYGRPRVRDRKIWGQVVPAGRVWRAGANEATTFTFSRALEVEGHALPAGTYTFFVIPRDREWTVIINRVPRQWGAFDYNPTFDALRFTVQSAETPHEESLRYTIEPSNPTPRS